MAEGFSFQDSREIRQNAVASAVPQYRGREQTRATEGRGRGRGGGYRGYSGNRKQGNTQRPPSAQRGQTDGGYPQPQDLFNILLNDYKGKTNLNLIRRLFPRNVNEEELKEWFHKAKKFAIFEDNSGKISFVSVLCRARLCAYYGENGCRNEKCRNFHICRDFFNGDCKYGNDCPQSHKFTDAHNEEVTRAHGLTSYDDRTRRTIARHSVLQVCDAYNKSKCNGNDGCSHLHVCENIISIGICDKEGCTLDHSFKSDHAMRLLKLFHLDNLLVKNIKIMRRSISIRKRRPTQNEHLHPRDSSAANQDTPQEIKEERRYRDGSARRTGPRILRQQSQESNKHSRPSTSDEKFDPRAPSPQVQKYIEQPQEIWAGPKSSGGGNPSIIKPLMDLRLDGSRNLKPTSRPKNRELITKPSPQSVYTKAGESSGYSKQMSPKAGNSLSEYICERFLSDETCTGCGDLHHKKPYAWFAKMFGEWYQVGSFEEEDLEKAYQKPEENSRHTVLMIAGVKHKVLVDFNKFTALFDAGSEIEMKRQTLRTAKWLWYKQMPGSVYIPLQPNETAEIEKHYKEDPNDSFPIITSGRTVFFIDLAAKTMSLVESSESYPLKRRPCKT